MTYMRCKRLWDFASFNRQSLEKIRRPEHFWLGTGIHYALERYALGDNPVEAFNSWANEALLKDREEYIKKVGVAPEPNEFDGYINQFALGNSMIRHYQSHWKSPIPKGYEYIEPELTLVAKIPGTDHELVMTLDTLLRKEGTDLYYVLDHKTYKNKPKEGTIRRSMQLLAYIWGVRNAMGVRCVGAIYDGMLKKMAESPKILKNGNLSKAVDSPTTFALFEQAIEDNNLIREEYEDRLEQLQEAGNQFFSRFVIVRTAAEIRSFEKNLASTVSEMANNPAIYPNFQWQGCWDCHFTDLCYAIEDDEDVEYIKEFNYHKREPMEGYRDGREE